jgi:Fe-S-cluster containining protein
MLPVPWRYVQNWNCTACGLCCKGFEVVLDFPEWINVVKNYGMEFTQPGISRFYLNKKSDDSCVFLYNFYGKWLCGLQHMKPIACKLWPFKISDTPKYGRPKEAVYNYGEKKLYVYVDPLCSGFQWGKPNQSFFKETLSEFVNLALGASRKQLYSTSQLFNFQQWKLI